jgi:hypothetical protein
MGKSKKAVRDQESVGYLYATTDVEGVTTLAAAPTGR